MHVEAVRLNAVRRALALGRSVGARAAWMIVVGRRARSPRRRLRPRMHPCPAVTYAPPQALARSAPRSCNA